VSTGDQEHKLGEPRFLENRYMKLNFEKKNKGKLFGNKNNEKIL
jgi:hypothetical protein